MAEFGSIHAIGDAFDNERTQHHLEEWTCVEGRAQRLLSDSLDAETRIDSAVLEIKGNIDSKTALRRKNMRLAK